LVRWTRKEVIKKVFFKSIFKFSSTFWRIDNWEDDSRRRKRFVPNPYGSVHSEASVYVQKTPEPPPTDDESVEDNKLKDLGHKMLTTAPKTNQINAELVDETEIGEEAVEPAEQRQGWFFNTEAIYLQHFLFLIDRTCMKWMSI
jgi:hypothetical protein